jgi:anti-anti-sigma factor
MPFGIQSEDRGAAVRLALTGDLDLATSREAEETIKEAEAGRPPLLVVDLSELEFMDSTGLRVILSAASRGEEEDRRVVIVKGPDVVQRVFEITRVAERLDMVDDASEVL